MSWLSCMFHLMFICLCQLPADEALNCVGKPKHDPKPAHEHKGGYGHTKPPKIPWVKNPKPVHEHKGHYGKPKHAKGHYGHTKPVKHEHAKPVKHEHKGHYGAFQATILHLASQQLHLM